MTESKEPMTDKPDEKVVNLAERIRALNPSRWGATITIVPSETWGHGIAQITSVWDPHLEHEVAKRCRIYAEALHALADQLTETAVLIDTDAAL